MLKIEIEREYLIEFIWGCTQKTRAELNGMTDEQMVELFIRIMKGDF